MSYEPTTWKAGDTVTSAKLNKIEQGIMNNGGTLIVRTTYDEDTQVETCDHTWQESMLYIFILMEIIIHFMLLRQMIILTIVMLIKLR